MQKQILSFLQKIPSNKVTTYKFLATKFHTHPRAVARILTSNTQQDIYPCYKVVCSDGKLGGYNLGIPEKIQRLAKDDIQVIDGKIPEKYIWQGDIRLVS